jgi:hypothetical protein
LAGSAIEKRRARHVEVKPEVVTNFDLGVSGDLDRRGLPGKRRPQHRLAAHRFDDLQLARCGVPFGRRVADTDMFGLNRSTDFCVGMA